jgi:signal transduction histidine kinase
MERTYDRIKGGGFSKKSFAAGTKDVVGSVARLRSVVGGSQPDRKRSEQKAQENERLSLLGCRAAVFGHEVANSLTVISSSLQFVEMKLETKQVDDPGLIAVVKGAVGEIDRLGSLLNEFRSPVSFQTSDLISADLVKVIEEVLALETLVCRARGIIVKFEFENAIPPVKLDAAKIKQVVLNLCKNAVEAMPQGGCLTLNVYQSDRTVVLEINDNGIGMSDSVNMFELFQTTKPGGSGIGLSVVQQIVWAHNGTITCTSDAGHGTTFKIVFPIAN